MELFLHRFGGSRFRESKDRGKMPSTQLFGVQLGCNSARAGDEKGRYRTENRLPQIGKSMGEAIKEFRKGTQSVEKEIKDLTDGDGLGLPICSLIASKMNGTLSIDPEYKKGSRFILVLQV